jgi:hypothetical protein
MGVAFGVTRCGKKELPPWPFPIRQFVTQRLEIGRRSCRMGVLFLLLNPNGSRWWRLKYRFGGREKLISLGTYPDVALKDARDRRDKARLLIAAGADPGEARKAKKRVARLNADNSFEAIAREWYAKHEPGWSQGHATRNLARLQADVFPWMGGRPIADLTPIEILDVLRRIEKRSALETAHRLRGIIGQVMRYSVATGRAVRNITADLRGALPPAHVQHYAAITDPRKVGELLRAIDGYSGTLPVSCALRCVSLGRNNAQPEIMRSPSWSNACHASRRRDEQGIRGSASYA